MCKRSTGFNRLEAVDFSVFVANKLWVYLLNLRHCYGARNIDFGRHALKANGTIIVLLLTNNYQKISMHRFTIWKKARNNNFWERGGYTVKSQGGYVDSHSKGVLFHFWVELFWLRKYSSQMYNLVHSACLCSLLFSNIYIIENISM